MAASWRGPGRVAFTHTALTAKSRRRHRSCRVTKASSPPDVRTMPKLSINAELAGVTTGLTQYQKRLVALDNASATNASLSDARAARALGRPLTDFGLWSRRTYGDIYFRLVRAAKFSKMVEKAALPPSTSRKHPDNALPTSSLTDYPPSLHTEYARVAAQSDRPAVQLTPTCTESPRGTMLCGRVLLAPDHLVDQSPLQIQDATQPAQVRAAAHGLMHRCLHRLGLHECQLLHHPSEPRENGIFADVAGTILRAEGDARLARAYEHAADAPLLVTSGGGDRPTRPELLYIPSVLKLDDVWEAALDADETRRLKRLMKACSSTASLMAFRLNDYYTIESAINELAPCKGLYHNNALHIRWSLHCNTNCAAIHQFPGKRRRTRSSDGTVIDPGNVKLCWSAGAPGHRDGAAQTTGRMGAKAAFTEIVVPLAKVIETVLAVAIPEALQAQLLPDVRRVLDLFDLDHNYLSVNIFWSPSASPRLPKYYYDRSKKRKRLGERHAGLYVHRDENNAGWGAVLIFGADLDGFEQRYITLSLKLPCPGWSLVVGDFRYLLHCVESGTGLRFSVVLAKHSSCTEGVDTLGREVCAP